MWKLHSRSNLFPFICLSRRISFYSVPKFPWEKFQGKDHKIKLKIKKKKKNGNHFVVKVIWAPFGKSFHIVDQFHVAIILRVLNLILNQTLYNP